jgi:hypothetical protein
MNDFLIHRARNMSIALDTKGMHNEAALINELLKECSGSAETVTIEREVFKGMMEQVTLFDFLVNNIGRLSLGLAGDPKNPKLQFAINPPHKRQQFLHQDVIDALIEIRYILKAPQYGGN